MIEDEVHFEIPGLQFVKVTDDSFRQVKKQNGQGNQSKRTTQRTKETSRTGRNAGAASVKAGKKAMGQAKQILVPKLQLGALDKSTP